jgi:hypothetical protein
MLTRQPANRPGEGTVLVTGKGFAGEEFEEFLAGQKLTLARPARKDDITPQYFPNWRLRGGPWPGAGARQGLSGPAKALASLLHEALPVMPP